MKADNDDDRQARGPERPPSMSGLYLIFAGSIAFVSIRLFVDLLRQNGFVTEGDGNGIVLFAMPIALLVIVGLGPGTRR
ncbi:hypothetical protein [Sphingobium fuliginis]|uniref:Uncharacterized protein n=1 Tax=Sphingobium fuliginis ATCC 27551 TaxID=1208342 RepID=A0A5B8CNP3_SPHSA|nr:hypothetical protein [Sphingobium fuliginis]QDC40323.1 hypothetical protein FIL70_24670 [Sphingobium fuliginis ATCC 27551]